MQTNRWLGVGSAQGIEPGAGTRAAEEALVRSDVKVLVVFCSQSHDLGALFQEIRTQAGEVPLIGCTTAGEIITGGPRDASVVVTALGGAGIAAGAPAAGFYTYGEIARTRGLRDFHNQTPVVLAVA